MPAPEKLAALRQLLAARFPSGSRPSGRVLATGIPALDDATGGLPQGALTEVVCAAPSCGSHLLLDQLLASTRAARRRVALIDSTDSFDPASFAPDLLTHLLWIRCAGAPTGRPPAASRPTATALQAADLLVRDANLDLVVLDLRRAPAGELRRVPPAHWYRLQRAVEPADLALLIETPRACVPSAQLRFVLPAPHPVEALGHERPRLAGRLHPALQRQRLSAAG